MAKKRDVWTFNFAKLDSVRAAIEEVIIPKIQAVRDDRTVMESDWLRFHNMWNVTHDSAHTYQGRAKLYIPEVRKNVESQARQMTEAMFPNEDFLSVSPGPGGSRHGAQIQKSIRIWQMEQAKLRQKMLVFNRQQALLGTSAAYVCWNKKVEYAFRRARDPKTGKINVNRELVELMNGPDFMVRDLFKWYALNPKKADIMEDGCVDFQVLNRFDLVARDRMGLLHDIAKIVEGNSDAYQKDELEKDIERMEAMGLTIENGRGYAGAASFRKEDKSSMGTYLCATVYVRVVCPEACLEGEDPDRGIPFKIEIYNGEHVGFAGRNPFFHQRPPYVVGKYILPNADEFYGQGIPWAIQYQQYEINSKAEQVMDATTFAVQPIAFIDPAMASEANEFELEPGAKWFAPPNAIKLGSFPDVSQSGYNAIQTLRSQMQSYSDLAPALPPQLQGKSRTATQADIIDRAVTIDNKTFQLQNEQEVLQPLMEMWESLTDQNIEEDQVIMILGRRSADWKRSLISKNQTLGSYRYFWKTASNQNNKLIQGRQMIDLMKVMMSMPPEIQQKLNADYAELIKVLWTEQFQLPDAQAIFQESDEMMAQDPEVVFKMLNLGMEVEVLPGDDDKAHMDYLAAKLPELKEGWLKQEVVRLILLHRVQLEKKQLIQQQRMEAMRQELIAQQQQAQAGAQGQAQPAQGGKARGSGNRTQLSPNASVGAMGTGVRA